MFTELVLCQASFWINLTSGLIFHPLVLNPNFFLYQNTCDLALTPSGMDSHPV